MSFITIAFLFTSQITCAAKPIIVQASKFPQHFKVTIKWKSKIPYQIEQNGSETIIVFDRDTDFQKLGFNHIPKFIKAIETSNIEGSFVTKLRIAETADLKFGWINGNFTLDVLNKPLKKSPQFKAKNPPKQRAASKSPQKVTVISNVIDGTPQLSFEWDKPVKAAAVHWGQNLIIAFDHPALFDFSGVIPSSINLFKKLSRVDVKQKSVFVLPLPTLYKPLIRHDKNKWIFQFSKIPARLPKTDLKIVRQPQESSSSGGDFIEFEAKDLGSFITLTDLGTGLKLTLFPSRDLIFREENYPQFKIIPSLLGLSILHKSQGITVESSENGFLLRSPTPLYISDDKDINRFRNSGQPEPLIKFTQYKSPLKSPFSQERNRIEAKAMRILGKTYKDFTHISKSKQLYPQLVELLTQSILENKKLSSLDLLILYKEFKAFVPDDTRKTLIQLKLVEASIALDLLENAQTMLEKLLTTVQEEELKLSSLYLLAEVYMRDGKFKKALELIKSQNSETVADFLKERKYLLTFKALLGMNLYDQAQELIDKNDAYQDTRLQRLELAWQLKDWETAQRILSTLVQTKWDIGEQHPDLILNYAIAAFFNNDKNKLKELRSVFLEDMKNTEKSEAFEILTSAEKELELTRYSLAGKFSEIKTFKKFVNRMRSNTPQTSTRDSY